jgi:hypothetical protein
MTSLSASRGSASEPPGTSARSGIQHYRMFEYGGNPRLSSRGGIHVSGGVASLRSALSKTTRKATANWTTAAATNASTISAPPHVRAVNAFYANTFQSVI